ncbi:hypothetical protein GCM10011512_13120 [Tersicoccus solisilvae]|uniref:Winged helix-turn-helix domain-containing protein n=1 Tax=Tersicoccus solisilvae TaxID=1882339 RepID=A0ABQ1NYU5_9MICC|nr:crosslink repair DNA glycosylase YcaQ family protein [Tersicoccus solisilvae]GGC87549.1 hypothetical protein GCM10011512_13120 [Tersicoccus solisilvae]
MVTRLGPAAARRIAIAAQALEVPHGQRPTSGRVTSAHIAALLRRIHLLQIDSVNVLCRSHYLPVLARLGPYDRDLLHRLSERPPRRLMEYWAHEASYIRPEHFADLRVWQRRRWVGLSALPEEAAAEHEQIAAGLVETLGRSRPMTASALAVALDHDHAVDRVAWGWNWTPTKRVLEHLFERGVVGAAGRTAQFERRYTLTERVLPPAVRGAPEPDPAAAADRLTEAAARALGVGTTRSVADYFRMPVQAATDSLTRLAADGVVVPVTVDGLDQPHWLHTAARRPRRVEARALLSPFDSLIFHRPRVEQLFGFHYRIGIYTPPDRREHGYYVLPFLLGDRLVARVDLKADRQHRTLLVQAAFAEPKAPQHTADELAAELGVMAGWLDLDDVAVAPRGDLAPALAAAVARAPGRR